VGRTLSIISTAVVTAILTSAFWIFAFNITRAPSDGRVSAAGDEATVDPAGGPPVAVAEGVTVGPAGLAIPVAGIKPSDLVDTFSQARAGGARIHDAIDIMASVGRPVVAAAPGRVEKIFFSPGGGGNTVYVRSPDGRWSYYYAHLNGYAPGLREGQQVRRGTPIGFVGFSGNANPAGPHLHFAINRMSAGDKWHEGAPINPYPLLAGKTASR
jgi:murein DD-endopeptidase MepM/ murein hydrolase activator NlpD